MILNRRDTGASAIFRIHCSQATNTETMSLLDTNVVQRSLPGHSDWDILSIHWSLRCLTGWQGLSPSSDPESDGFP